MAAFMAAWRSQTAALRWRWPWRLNLKLGRASANPAKPSAQDYVEKGGLRLSSHDDGRGGDAPVRSARRNGLPITASERLWARRDGGITEVPLRWQLGDEVQACAGYGNGGGGTVLGGAVLLRKAKEEAREMKIVSAGRERASAG